MMVLPAFNTQNTDKFAKAVNACASKNQITMHQVVGLPSNASLLTTELVNVGFNLDESQALVFVLHNTQEDCLQAVGEGKLTGYPN